MRYNRQYTMKELELVVDLNSTRVDQIIQTEDNTQHNYLQEEIQESLESRTQSINSPVHNKEENISKRRKSNNRKGGKGQSHHTEATKNTVADS